MTKEFFQGDLRDRADPADRDAPARRLRLIKRPCEIEAMRRAA